MSIFIKSILLLSLSSVISISVAQTIYGPSGEYKGYMQTSPSGVTNVYNSQGQNTQSFQTDNGQTNFYSPTGRYEGTVTAPIQPQPNTSINAPRQVPQAPSVKGW